MTGFRVGYICANEEIISNLTKLHENMIASISEPLQLVAIEAVYHGEDAVKEMVDYYDRNRHLIVDRLNRINGFSCIYPKGAFYVSQIIAESADHIVYLDKDDLSDLIRASFVASGEDVDMDGEFIWFRWNAYRFQEFSLIHKT